MSFIEQACRTCKNYPICAVYPVIKSTQALNEAMIGCAFYEEKDHSNVDPYPEHHSLDIQERLKIAEQIRAENITDDMDDVIQPQHGVKCSACGKDNVQLVRCTKCGALCCGDCITETFSGESLCPACYENSDVTSSFLLK